LIVLTVGYWIMSTPFAADWLESTLSSGFAPAENSRELSEAQAIVLLGGGSVTYFSRGEAINVLSGAGALRALEAARLYRLMDDPLVFASGGMTADLGQFAPESEALRDALIKLGVPGERIVLETFSQDTHEQALHMIPLLEAQGVGRFVLVTSSSHMRRALTTFKAVGLDPIPAIAPSSSEIPAELAAPESGSGREHEYGEGTDSQEPVRPTPFWLPNRDSLGQSQTVMREYLALLYYALRGWLK
jgi:uncharacterized SAM-binding protein YcdF (DUF218 family)